MQVEPCVNSQNYRNICRRVRIGKGAVTLITLLSRGGREINIDLIHTPWPPLTHHYTAASFLRIIEIFVGEWEGGRGQWPNYYALPGRERSKYWFNSQTVTTTDSPFYGKRFNPTEKEGLHQILYCVHTYSWYCISMQEDTA